MKAVKKVLLVLILTVLIFPWFQGIFEPIRSDGLKGAFVPAPEPRFTWKTWFSGSYQDSAANNINDSLPFRADLVRLNNQLDYSLFNIPHGKSVVAGLNGNLFLIEYIEGYLGQGYQSRRFMADKVKMLARVQEILWREKKIFVLLVIPPDKGTFFSGDIPGRYLKNGCDPSCREFLLDQLHSCGVHMIDFMPVFMKMRGVSEYPLFANAGIHWSDYASFLAADSMFRYITANSGYRFPEMTASAFEVSRTARHDDDDISRTMNLIWSANKMELAYPVITYKWDTASQKPSALFVGDSFYWGFYNQGIIENMFSNIEYWFYDRLVFPEAFRRAALTSELDLEEAVERQNILVILHVGAGWGNPGAGIIDRLYATYDTSASNPIRKIEEEIRENSQWYDHIRSKAVSENVPVERKVRAEAIYVYNSKLLQTK